MTTTISTIVEASGGQLIEPSNTGTPIDEVLTTTIVDATHDSRAVEPDWLYCCITGENADGHDFAEQAAERGASLLLVERPLDVDVPQILVADSRQATGWSAAAVHGQPGEELQLVGVTGTNGKSSIVQLMADMWRQVGTPADMVGTLHGARTTPEGTDLQRLLRRAVNRGIEAVAMEVSSHALSLHRVAGTRFDVAIFTNLGRDHLDFHHTMDEYFEAKAALFTPSYASAAVINVDDPFGRRLHDRVDIAATGFGLADAEDLHFVGPTSRFQWRGHQIVLQLAGSHSVLNALAAATCSELLGMEPVDIADALCATSPVRGRFEVVDAGQPFHVAVDYAHTPDALAAALGAARQVAGDARVIVVFGCGGDRDVQKRPEMGQVAEQNADVVIITSDNPRSERPSSIIDDVLQGIERTNEVVVEPDRRAAIATAIGHAKVGDIVLIAGKGHETYQIVGDLTLDFDDRQVALEALGVGQ